MEAGQSFDVGGHAGRQAHRSLSRFHSPEKIAGKREMVARQRENPRLCDRVIEPFSHALGLPEALGDSCLVTKQPEGVAQVEAHVEFALEPLACLRKASERSEPLLEANHRFPMRRSGVRPEARLVEMDGRRAPGIVNAPGLRRPARRPRPARPGP